MALATEQGVRNAFWKRQRKGILYTRKVQLSTVLKKEKRIEVIETETFEFVYQIFWLVLAFGGAAFILVLLWNLHTENKEREKAYKESKDD